jgi:hypothetical protein
MGQLIPNYEFNEKLRRRQVGRFFWRVTEVREPLVQSAHGVKVPAAHQRSDVSTKKRHFFGQVSEWVCGSSNKVRS